MGSDDAVVLLCSVVVLPLGFFSRISSIADTFITQYLELFSTVMYIKTDVPVLVP